MKKVKFLTTSAGDYGTAFKDDEKEVTDSLATQLEEAGTVKVLGSAGKDPVVGTTNTVSIKDETSKTGTQVLKPTVKATSKKAAPKKGK